MSEIWKDVQCEIVPLRCYTWLQTWIHSGSTLVDAGKWGFSNRETWVQSHTHPKTCILSSLQYTVIVIGNWPSPTVRWKNCKGEMRTEKRIMVEWGHECGTQQWLAVYPTWASPDPRIVFGKLSSLFSVECLVSSGWQVLRTEATMQQGEPLSVMPASYIRMC